MVNILNCHSDQLADLLGVDLLADLPIAILDHKMSVAM